METVDYRLNDALGPRLAGWTAVTIGVVGAALLHWTCDDAFISLRYADNLVAGQGLVWNPAERVEGITNLLWTLALAAGRAAGADARVLAEGLGILAFLCVLLAVWWWEQRRWPTQIPWAVALLAVLPDLRVWSTGGLETMAAALAATGQVLAIWQGRRAWAGGLAVVGWLLRPDAVLTAAVVVLVDAQLAWPDRRVLLRRLAAGLAPLALAVGVTTAWRWSYYGDALPNTFWAKSAASGWWSQGLVYVGLTALTAWPAAAGLGWACRRARTLQHADRAWVIGLLGAVTLHTVYVIHSGGDFMHARRLVPVLPLCVLAFRLALPSDLRALKKRLTVILALSAIPLPIFALASQGRIHGVADERAFYPQELMDLRIAQGQALGAALHGVPAPLLIEGGLCVLAWASGLPTIIEANGLTDRTIARQPIAERSLAGHEKHPTEAYLDSRHVSAVVLHGQPRRSADFDVAHDPKTRLSLALRYYDPAVLAALAVAGWRTPKPESTRELAANVSAEAPCDVAPQLLGHLSGLLRETATGADRGRWRASLAARCPPPGR